MPSYRRLDDATLLGIYNDQRRPFYERNDAIDELIARRWQQAFGDTRAQLAVTREFLEQQGEYDWEDGEFADSELRDQLDHAWAIGDEETVAAILADVDTRIR